MMSTFPTLEARQPEKVVLVLSLYTNSPLHVGRLLLLTKFNRWTVPKRSVLLGVNKLG